MLSLYSDKPTTSMASAQALYEIVLTEDCPRASALPSATARTGITRNPIAHDGFCIVAAETDWFDADSIGHYLRQCLGNCVKNQDDNSGFMNVSNKLLLML